MVDLKETVLQFLFSHYNPNPSLPIVVACSGGADSLCLLHLLKPVFSQIIVAHFNHRLRVEADEDADYTVAIAREMGLAVVVESADVRAFAIKEKRGIEEAARMLRYRFLFSVAREYHAQAVAVGHHADDQVETVLLHFLRGTGSSGLRGMLPVQWSHPWDSEIPLIRPLLAVWKKDIFEYCRENHLTPLVDQSNTDLAYLRNRLRHVLIPQLEKEYNAQIKQCLWQTAQVLAVEVGFIEEETEKAWQQCVISADSIEIVLSAEKFQQLHLAMQRTLLRRAIWKLFPEMRDIDFESTQRGLEFFKSCSETQPKRSRKLHLMKELFIFYEKALKTADKQGEEVFVIARLAKDTGGVSQAENLALASSFSPYPKAPGEPQKVEIPSYIKLYGWIFHCKEQFFSGNIGDYGLIKQNADPFTAYLDLELIGKECETLLLRGRKEGDRFQPLGLESGTVKLSDYMINVKIPQRFRNDWLLLCCNEKIIWVAGYQIAHPYRVTTKTKRVLCVQVERVVMNNS